MSTPTVEWTRLENQAGEVERVARMRGWAMPKDYTDARATAAAAARIGNEPAPVLATLPPAKDVAEIIDRHAAALDAWRGRTAVAQELHERANRAAVAAARDAAPHITARLVEEANEQLLPALLALLDNGAPRDLTGHETADQLAAHAELLRAVEQLSAAALDRARLALATDDSTDLGRSGPGWLLLDPTDPHITLGAISAALAALRDDGIPTTLDRWLPLLRIGVRFAHVGEAAQRMARFDELRRYAAQGPDGGMMADLKTIGELADLAATAATAAS